MKKIIIFTLAIFLSALKTYATCDFTDKCAKNPYINKKSSQMKEKTPMTTSLAESIIKFVAKKSLGSASIENFDVKLDSWGTTYLMRGKFKGIEIDTNNLLVDGIYLSNLNLKTLCDYNYIKISRKNVIFKENFLLNFKMIMTNDDLQKTMNSNSYIKKIRNTKLSINNYTFAKLQDVDAFIENDKIVFKLKIVSPFINTIKISISSSIKVKNGRIILVPEEKTLLHDFETILNLLNPLEYSFEIFNNKDNKIKIQNVKINGDKIETDGIIFIPKNTKQKVVDSE